MGAGGGEVTPLQTVYVLADAARQRGTTARTGVAATDVRVDNETVRGVRTAAGETVASDVVVNAGGPWAGTLLESLNLDYPLQALRPERASLEPPGDFGERTAIYDESVRPDFLDFARSAISERLPSFERAVSWGGCGALYTITPDAHPLVGPVPEVDGLYLVSGFSGHGFKLAPAVGAGVAALITGGDPDPFDPGFFAVDRLRKDRPVTVPYSCGILGGVPSGGGSTGTGVENTARVQTSCVSPPHLHAQTPMRKTCGEAPDTGDRDRPTV